MKGIIQNLIFSLLFFSNIHADVERRAAIDVGSGGTKIAIAEVDVDTRLITNVLYENSFPVPYQASLDKSEEGLFDEETKRLGLNTFKKIKEIIDQYEVEKVVAVATSAFRKANNSREYIADVKAIGIDIQVISQREEGEIAYFSAFASGNVDPERTVVWDIGTGSLQMTTANSNGTLTVYMGEQMGSIAFRNYIISTVQDNDLEEVSTPNPMTEDDLHEADRYARAFGRGAYLIIKERIKQGHIVGIGRLFSSSLGPIASENGVITRTALREYIKEALNKTDEELNNPFAHVDVTNCVLTLAIMKALHIHEVVLIEATTTRGILVTPFYWSKT